MNSTSDSHPTLDQLAGFDAGHLVGLERESVERHLAGCDQCCQTLEGLPETPLAALVRAYAGPTESLAPGEAIPPELIGHPRYRVLGPAGMGGMGVVYKAVQIAFDRVVALKVIRPGLAERGDFVARFRKEVKTVGRLRHPGIAAAQDADQSGDLHFLVLEYVEGPSLADLLARTSGPLPVPLACDWIRQAALALQHAHDQGIVHRDIKPANLLLTPSGQVKLIDFGLARGASVGEGTENDREMLGTPDYLAPEQARNPAGVDGRADLYALGCTLYQLLTGHPPFPTGTTLEKLLAHQERRPRPVRELRPEVPVRVAELLDRLLDKDASRRPASPAAVASVLAGEPPPRASSHRWVWLVGVAALLFSGVVLALNWGSPQVAPAGEQQEPSPMEIRKEAAPSKPVPEPDLLTPEMRLEAQQERREALLAWLSENKRGPGGTLLEDTTKTVDAALAKHDGVQVQLGSRLVKSGRPTILAIQRGGAFLFEFPEGADADLDLKPNHTRAYSYRASAEERRTRPCILISDLIIDRAEALPRGKRITGSVAYRFLARCESAPFVRLLYYPRPGKVRCSGMFYPRPEVQEGEGRIVFDLPEVNPTYTSGERVVVGYLEMLTRAEGKTVVESNTLAILLRPVPAER